MPEKTRSQVTAVLHAAQAGDRDAAARLLSLVYDELHELARAQMARLPPGQTLQPTALVNEVYLRLLGKSEQRLESRKHFFCTAAQAMRHMLVDQARRKARVKHGGGRRRVELHGLAVEGPPADEVLALHEALGELEREDPLKAQIVQLRYFAGMTMKETADVLGLSERTAHRHWRFIKAWLKSRLGEPE
jgi:RNA polymerase sigma factor (TIGR02999 family)